MKLDDFGLDRVRIFGQPYHGLWKAGSIALPNETTKTCPAPANGASVLLKVPDQATVTRSETDAAADVAAGREWRNYGLISGGRYGASAPLYEAGSATILYIDPSKKRWLVRFTQVQSTRGAYGLKVRRFGHVDGTTQGWSAPFVLYFTDQDSVFWDQDTAIFPLGTIAQNSNGSEGVIGSSIAMMKITISGTVDLGATGYGLTVGHELLEYEGRPCLTITQTTRVTGVNGSTQTVSYHQEADGAPTGATYDWVTVRLEGEVTENNGEPTYVEGFSWVMDSETTVYSSQKIEEGEIVRQGTKHIGAGYSGDVLKLVSHDYFESTKGWTCFAADPTYVGPGVERPSGPGDYRLRLKAKIGETVINEQTVFVAGGSPPAGYTTWPGSVPTSTIPLPARFCDGFEETINMFPDESQRAFKSWEYYTPLSPFELLDENGSRRSTYLTCLRETSLGWKNPVVALITETIFYDGVNPPVTSYATHSVHAPSLTMETTAIPIDNLYAAWQPVTDQLVVDSVPVCWF